MSREEILAKNTAILAFGKVCTQLVSFLLVSLYTAVLETEEYGTFDLLLTYSTLLLPMVSWQMDQGLFRFMLENRKKQNKLSELYTLSLLLSLIQTCIYIFLISIIKMIIPISSSWFLSVYVPLQVFVALNMQFARGLGKNKIYAAAGFISAVSTIALNIITLLILKWGISGLLLSTVAGQIISLIYLVAATKGWNYLSIKALRKDTYKELVGYSLPLVPNHLAWWVVNASDRIVIKNFLGLSFNGIFTVASKFPSVFIHIYDIVNLSWTESVSIHFCDEDRDEYLSRTMTVFFKIFSSGCFLIVAAMPFMFPLFINVKYHAAYNQILILMYAMMFRVMVGLYSGVYIAEKKSKKVAYTSISAAAINLSVDLMLIRVIDLYAASVSSLAAFMSLYIFRYIDINRNIHMKIAHKPMISAGIIGGLLTFAYYSDLRWFQALMLIAVIIYSVLANLGIIKSIFNLIKKFSPSFKKPGTGV